MKKYGYICLSDFQLFGKNHLLLSFNLTLALKVTILFFLLAPSFAAAGSSGEVTLQGVVAEDCWIDNVPATVHLGDLGQSSSDAIPFDFSCNAPFQYSLTSQNGALVHVMQSGVTGFASQLGYAVDVSLPTDTGAGIADTCASSEIAAGAVTCSFSDSGADIALNKTGSLTLSWTAPARGAATPLLAGDYADSLTLTIAMQP